MANVLKEGINLYNKKNYNEALIFFLTLSPEIKQKADNLDLAYYIGLCYARLTRYDEALAYLEQVVTSGEDVERINQCRLVLSVIYSMTGRTKMAEYELQKLLETGYKTASVFSGLAYVAWEQKNVNLSIEYYEKALTIDKENPTALNGLGYVLACSDKDLTKALFLCKKAVDYYPESAAFLDSLGWVYHKLGLEKEAITFIKRAMDINPSIDEIKNHYKEVYGKREGS